MKKLITIFGPSECTAGDPVYDRAYELGKLLAQSGFAVVTGGYEGVMEAASRGASQEGGSVVGVTANVFFNRGRVMNPYVKKELRVSSAIDRTMELISLADAYVACGISPGTLAEVATVWDFFIKKFIEVKPLLLVGEEWKELCSVLFSSAAYSGKTEYATILETPQQVERYLIGHFGTQLKLPDLQIIQ